LNRLRSGLAQEITARFAAVDKASTITRFGRVVSSFGETVEVSGLQAPAGARCLIEGLDGDWMPAEVVGFTAHTLKMMPERGRHGVRRGARVQQAETSWMPAVGWGLLGR